MTTTSSLAAPASLSTCYCARRTGVDVGVGVRAEYCGRKRVWCYAACLCTDWRCERVYVLEVGALELLVYGGLTVVNCRGGVTAQLRATNQPRDRHRGSRKLHEHTECV